MHIHSIRRWPIRFFILRKPIAERKSTNIVLRPGALFYLGLVDGPKLSYTGSIVLLHLSVILFQEFLLIVSVITRQIIPACGPLPQNTFAEFHFTLREK